MLRRTRTAVLGTIVFATSFAAVAGGTTAAHAAGEPVVSIGIANVWEGHVKNRAASVAVTLSEPTATSVTVSYAITAGTASAGKPTEASTFADFKAKTGTLTFRPNVVVKYIAVNVYGDERAEPDETVNIALSNPVNADPGVMNSVTTIHDDDDGSAPGTVASIGDASVTEGNTKQRAIKFQLNITRVATSPVTVSYRVIAGTATGGWTGGGYAAPAGAEVADRFGQSKSVTFTNAAVQKFIVVKLVPDVAGEEDETFRVELTGITGPATIGDDEATGTIFDDDPPSTAWVDISAGGDHTCGITTAGAAYCWGNNTKGQLGNGTNTSSLVPVPVTGLSSGVAQIAAGGASTCAITTTGDASCWGGGQYGELGNGGTADSNVPVPVTGLTGNTSEISVGESTACAVVSGGAKCWGNNFFGQVGDGTLTSRDTPTAVSGLASGVAHISTGYAESCASTTAGAALCWGHREGSIPSVISGSDVATISVGGQAQFGPASHVCLTTTSGAAHCLGTNGKGQLGNGTTTGSPTPVPVTGLGSGVADMKAGGYIGGGFSCALTTAGAVRCTGVNDNGQLGDASTTEAHTVTAVAGLSSGVVQITAGETHACARTAGAVYCWGANSNGQLGDGTNKGRTAPASVSAP